MAKKNNDYGYEETVVTLTDEDGVDKDFYIDEIYEVNGKTYNASTEYKIAFICTSSKKGDAYEGAPNSTLMLDDLKITFEK